MILNNSYALFVPSTINGQTPAIEIQSEVTNWIVDRMADMFGGATIYNAKGAYKMSSGQIVVEDINIVESSACDNSKTSEMIELAKYVCNKMTQESIALKIDGKLHIIEREINKIMENLPKWPN